MISEKSKVSCVIPAFNEGVRIGQVLALVVAHPLISEVVVVDDGSSDNTKEIISQYPTAKLIVHPQNQGKSVAICTGVKEAKEDLILMLDADLVGLTEQNLTDLIRPVLFGETDISLSLVKNSPYRLIGLDFLSGQRVLPRETLVTHLADISRLPNFGLEVFLNNLILKDQQRIKIVPWFNAYSPLKFRKYGFWTGMWADLKMNVDILKTVSPVTIVRQITQMRKLKV